MKAGKRMESSTRREFLKVGAAAAAGVSVSAQALAASNQFSKEIRVGVIGCGGRGSGAAFNALMADPNVVLWAMADAFAERVQSSLNSLRSSGALDARIQVPAERQFVGLDAYQKLLASGVDVVLLATPPAFRPEHLRAAVESGKHVFSEKPMAVDMEGVRSVMASTELAKQKNLSIQHGFCWRFDSGMRSAFGEISSGKYGAARSFLGSYFFNIPKPMSAGEKKPSGMSDVEWQLRWWTNFEWLSGGLFVEQAVHTIDKMSWAMGDVLPIAAVGTGGRIQRDDAGNVYDHYHVSYEYPHGVVCQIGARQMTGCYNEVADRVICEKATLVGPKNPRVVGVDGKTEWRYRKEPKERSMYQVCHDEFFQSLRDGKVINGGDFMAQSTALAILGREAAHSGKRVKWQDLTGLKQQLVPANLKMEDAMPIAPPAVPGR